MTPRFLADESCDFGAVRVLREAGYNVLAVVEWMTRSDDEVLIRQAAEEQRILLTEDKDFGWLVYVSRMDSAGVILIRYPGQARDALGEAIVALVKEHGEEIGGAFAVMQPGWVRIRKRP
jgi:predicted nuclease of predicted toxin-antitoxin system